MFLIPIVPGTLPLLPQPQKVIGAGGATVRSPPGCVPRAAEQQLTTDAHGASHAHDGHTHTVLRSPRPVATCRPPWTWRLLDGKDRQGGVEVEELQQPEGDQGGRGIGEI